MQRLVTFLSATSVVGLYPWAETGEGIWLFPKLLPLVLLTLLNIGWVIRRGYRFNKKHLIFWGLFLGWGALCTALSLYPARSFWGDSMIGDGWLYYAIVGLFFVSNSAFIDEQKRGLRWGSTIVAGVLIFQVLNYYFGFFEGFGFQDTYLDGLLSGKIWDIQSPISLFSHRGHAAIVLVMLSFVFREKKLPYGLSVVALVFSQTRAALLAHAVGVIYLSVRDRKVPYREVILYGVSFLALYLMSDKVTSRTMEVFKDVAVMGEASPNIHTRAHFWHVAFQGIRKRPLAGWGFNGFAIAYPFVTGCAKPSDVGESTFAEPDAVASKDTKVCDIPTTKAHNSYLDTALSVGLPGLLLYWAGFLYFCLRQKEKWITAAGLSYLVFGLFWFECGQYTHLMWWILSLSNVRFSYSLPSRPPSD